MITVTAPAAVTSQELSFWGLDYHIKTHKKCVLALKVGGDGYLSRAAVNGAVTVEIFTICSHGHSLKIGLLNYP